MVAKCTFVYPKMDSVAAEICNGITSRLLMKMPKKLVRTRKRLARGRSRIDVKRPDVEINLLHAEFLLSTFRYDTTVSRRRPGPRSYGRYE